MMIPLTCLFLLELSCVVLIVAEHDFSQDPWQRTLAKKHWKEECLGSRCRVRKAFLFLEDHWWRRIWLNRMTMSSTSFVSLMIYQSSSITVSLYSFSCLHWLRRRWCCETTDDDDPVLTDPLLDMFPLQRCLPLIKRLSRLSCHGKVSLTGSSSPLRLFVLFNSLCQNKYPRTQKESSKQREALREGSHPEMDHHRRHERRRDTKGHIIQWSWSANKGRKWLQDLLSKDSLEMTFSFRIFVPLFSYLLHISLQTISFSVSVIALIMIIKRLTASDKKESVFSSCFRYILISFNVP